MVLRPACAALLLVLPSLLGAQATLHPAYTLTAASFAPIAAALPDELRPAVLADPQRFLAAYLPLLSQPDDLLVLVDKQHELPADYEPADLTPLRSPAFTVNRADLRFRKAYLPALSGLQNAARKAGLKLSLSSSYRSWAYQKDLFQRYAAKDGLATAERYSARPGRSQHQLGTVIDFGSVTPAFAATPEGAWLAQNAASFGFSLSYPEGREALTGYIAEPWHYRYIGPEACAVQKAWFGDVQQYLTAFHAAQGLRPQGGLGQENPVRALLAHLRPYRGSIALTLTLLLVQSLAELGLPTLMAGIIDHGVLGANPAAIWLNGAGMLAVSLLSAAAALASSYVSARLGAGYGRDLRSAVFARITHLPPERFELFGAATLITRTTNDVTQVQGFVVMALRMLASAPLMAAGGVIMALLLDAPLAVVLLVAVPVLGLLIATVARRGVVLFRVVQEKIDRLNQVLRETLTGVRVIRAFDRQAQDAERFDRANLDLSDISLRTARLMAFVFPGLMLAMSLTSIALVWFGGLRIQAGHLPVGGLLAFIQYATMILFSLMMMSILFVVLPRAAVSAGRINEVLDLPPEPAAGPPTAQDAPADRAGPGASSLEFRDVTFRYPGAEVPALDKLSFRVAPGSVAALIGGTGAGKTTVLQLLLRFHEAGEGQVLVDGRDVRTWDKAALRARFGLAPQKARLFTGTIAANLRWARPEASDQELAEALVTSQAASFVAELPDGTEHRIDKGGVNLSGGQRQRISLARALLRRPPVLLFDDSFSALDARTEADLREAVRARAAGSTVLVVAQRVSSVRGADQIIVLEDGRVAATGTHRELLASSAVYREIAASQEPEETP